MKTTKEVDREVNTVKTKHTSGRQDACQNHSNLNPSGYYIYSYTTCFNALNLFNLPTKCACGFRLVLTVNSEYSPNNINGLVLVAEM
jgi:hypothetical protein